MDGADNPHQDAYLDEAYRLDTPDAELYFELVGPPDAPVIFYLHGGPGYNSHSFRDLVGDELAAFRVIYADQRGAGRSLADTGADLGVEAMAGDVFAILDALRISRATLLAHGFGATVAAAAARRAPERVERLVWVNPWVTMPELAKTLQLEAAKLAGREADADDLTELPPAERVREAVQGGGRQKPFRHASLPKRGQPDAPRTRRRRTLCRVARKRADRQLAEPLGVRSRPRAAPSSRAPDRRSPRQTGPELLSASGRTRFRGAASRPRQSFRRRPLPLARRP